MSLSLYSAFVPSCLQILRALNQIADMAIEHCHKNNIEEAEWVNAKLAEDMLHLAYQFKAATEHSSSAVIGVKAGVFSPYMGPIPTTFSEIKEDLANAIAGLEALSEEDLESYMDKPMVFKMNDFRMDFTAQDFLLSFSQPNFYFHATTAYDILRANGLKLSKANYLGAMRQVPK